MCRLKTEKKNFVRRTVIVAWVEWKLLWLLKINIFLASVLHLIRESHWWWHQRKHVNNKSFVFLSLHHELNGNSIISIQRIKNRTTKKTTTEEKFLAFFQLIKFIFMFMFYAGVYIRTHMYESEVESCCWTSTQVKAFCVLEWGNIKPAFCIFLEYSISWK